jgi:hypothetical protein
MAEDGTGSDRGPASPGAGSGKEAGPDETYEAAFRRIEAAVDGGRTDLGALGFWALLRRIKPDPVLSDHWADVAGRIDRKAFERGVRWRFPVWLGNAALVVGTGLGGMAAAVALGAANSAVAGSALLVAAGAWSVSLHGLAHWAVGRARGIAFTCYFFRPGQLPPRPGIKTDYATYLRADPSGRASMHGAGALATKVAPFVALAFAPATTAPAWAVAAVIALGVGQVVTDVLFSRKTGDWSKVRRERAVAAARAADR